MVALIKEVSVARMKNGAHLPIPLMGEAEVERIFLLPY